MKKKVLLFSLFILVFGLLGEAEELCLKDKLFFPKGELPSLLLSKDFSEKANLINHLNAGDFIATLKSDDEKLVLDSIVTKEWSEESQSLVNAVRYNYTFENDGQYIVVKIYNWNSEENGWRITNQVLYEFNDLGNMIRAEFQKYIAPLYKTYTKIEYSYFENLLTEEILWEKSFDEDPWEMLEQTAYEYDSVKLLSAVYTSEWEDYDKIWLVQNRTEYKHDTLGNLIYEAGFDYDSYTMLWEQKYYTEHVFDSNSNLTLSIEYVPGWEDGIFIENKKLEKVYNTISEIVKETFYIWDYDLDGWLPLEKLEYSNNEIGKLYEKLSYAWNAANQNWDLSNRLDFLSIENSTDQDILYWDFIDVHFPVYSFGNKVCDKIEEYGLLDSEWIKTGITTYHFAPKTIVGLDQIVLADVRVYPNPVIDYLTIEIDNSFNTDYLIRDINGKIIVQSTLINNERISLSDFKAGYYFIELVQAGQRIYSGKILNM